MAESIEALNLEKDDLIYRIASKDPKGLEEYQRRAKDGTAKLNPTRIIDLYVRGLSEKEITTIVNAELPLDDQTTPASVADVITKYRPTINRAKVEKYISDRPMILNELESIAVEKLKEKLTNSHWDISLRDIAYAMSTIFEKRRLEEDKSTSNVASRHDVILQNIFKRRSESFDE